jgi:hypothetical protein
MKNYEQLKKVIQEANPEIMELKFGCELIDKKTGDKNIIFDDYNYNAKLLTGCNVLEKGAIYSWYKILGRPITLEDVLIALDKVNQKILWATDEEREDEKQLITKELAYLLAEWEWGKPLDEQSDETLSFLTKLLVK